MFKNGKMAILCLVAPLSCIGCNNNNNRGKDKLLDRKTYGQTVDTLVEGGIQDALIEKMYKMQISKIKVDTTTQGDDCYRYIYNTPTNAVLTENADIAINASARIIVEGSDPIELNNLVADINDTITTSWDLSKGYVKTTDSLGGVNYVIKEETKNETKYWQCFDNPVIDQKVKMDITTYINHLGGGDDGLGLKNYIVIQSAKNIGYFQEDRWEEGEYVSDYDNMISGIGLDISGFGGYFSYDRTEEEAKIQYAYQNEIALPYLIAEGAKKIDEYIPDIEKLLKAYVDANLIHTYTKEEDNSKLSINFGFNELDLDKLAETINEKVEEISESYYLEASGKGAVDYFVSYEQNFIHQQELVLNFKDANFAMYPKTSEGELLLDINKANINGVINENLDFDKCTPDTVDLTQYTEI